MKAVSGKINLLLLPVIGNLVSSLFHSLHLLAKDVRLHISEQTASVLQRGDRIY